MNAFLLALICLGQKQADNSEILAIARAARIPVTSAELFPAYKGDPSKNAATYLAAVQKIPDNPAYAKACEIKPNPVLIRDELKSLSAEFDLVEKFTACPDYAPIDRGTISEVDSDFKDQSGLGAFKIAAKMLVARSTVRLQDGDKRGALTDLERLVHLSNLVGLHPTLIGSLVRSVIGNMSVNQSLNLSPEAVKSPLFAKELVSQLDQMAPLNFSTAFRGEAANSFVVATRPISQSIDLDQMQSEEQKKIVMQAERDRPIWGKAFVSAYGGFMSILESNSSSVENLEVAEHEFFGPIENSKDSRMRIIQVLAPVFKEMAITVRMDSARFELARIALVAVETSSPPLVNGTHDPFGSQPYKMFTTPNGWVIYSIGKDNKDDGGKARADLAVEFDGTKLFLRK